MPHSDYVAPYFAFGEFRIWSHLAWRDLTVRYSRTRLGPWWSTIALASMILGIAVASSLIAQVPVANYLAKVAISLYIWTFIANVLQESIDLFLIERSILLNLRMNVYGLVLRVICRQFVLSLYTLPVVLVCMLIEQEEFQIKFLFLTPVIAGTGLAMIFPSFLVAYLTLVRRDLSQLIPSCIQLLFFVSPIMWTIPDYGRLHLVSQLNPISWCITSAEILVGRSHGGLMNLVLWLTTIGVSILAISVTGPLAQKIRLRL